MKKLIKVIDNASELAKNDPEAFTMLRRQGFGASDSSILLGVNPFPDNTIENLIEEKKSSVITAKELAIGKMVNVRKGSDLEPIIIEKFQQKYLKENPTAIVKPSAMYRIPDTPLTINFDGVMHISPFVVPVECKFVSTWGGKYWNQVKAIGDKLLGGTDLEDLGTEVNSIYLTKRAEEAGIPIYYYTQVQQQMLALDSPFGYVTALFDKDWELYTFRVMADERVQNKLIEEANKVWEMITN